RSATQNVLDVIEKIATSTTPLTVKQLSIETGIAASTLYRVVKILEQSRVLVLEPGSRGYSAGGWLLNVAREMKEHSQLHEQRRAILRVLVEQIGETCNFTSMNGPEVTYVDRIESKWPLGLHLEPGSKVPIHCTSS